MKRYLKHSAIIVCIFIMLQSIFVGTFFIAGSAAESNNPMVSALDRVEVGTPFGLCHAGYSQGVDEYAQLNAMGDKWMRVDISWSGVEPANDQWNFANWHSYLDVAQANNKKVLFILDYSNPWLNLTRNYVPAEYIPYFLDYVNTTVREFMNHPAMGAWEIWNEPNGEGFWNATDEEFFALFNATANLLHEIDPALVVGGAVVAGHDPDYIERMFQANLMQYIDAISFHPYSVDPDEIYWKTREVQALGAKYGFQGEYWITEVGNPTGGRYGHRCTPEELSDRVTKSLVYASITDMKILIWYCLYDAGWETKSNDPMNSEWYFGLLYPNNTWKPGAYSFQIFGQRIANKTFLPDLIHMNQVLLTPFIRAFLFRNQLGESVLILWAEPDPLELATKSVTLAFSGQISELQQVNIFNGTTSEPESMSFALDHWPVVLTFTAANFEDSIDITIMDSVLYWIIVIGGPALIIGVVVAAVKLRKKIIPQNIVALKAKSD